jgi:ubiquinone/menaquinone biosynthesis C-methylase UbiE
MHEMRSAQLPQIFEEVYRVIKPGGLFILVDFHRLTNPVFWAGLGEFVGRSGMAIVQFRRRSATKTLCWWQHSSNPSSKVISNPVASSGLKSRQPSTITEAATGIDIIYLR